MLQVIAQVERNDAYLLADFLTKRGQHPIVGPTANPPDDWHQGSKVSDVLGAFIQALASAKVCRYHAVADLCVCIYCKCYASYWLCFDAKVQCALTALSSMMPLVK